jgi:hypothetical protein
MVGCHFGLLFLRGCQSWLLRRGTSFMTDDGPCFIFFLTIHGERNPNQNTKNTTTTRTGRRIDLYRRLISPCPIGFSLGSLLWKKMSFCTQPKAHLRVEKNEHAPGYIAYRHYPEARLTPGSRLERRGGYIVDQSSQKSKYVPLRAFHRRAVAAAAMWRIIIRASR